MIRDICKDEFFLSQKAEPATADDLTIAQDLLDTLAAHKDGCVGMAANMIGVNKRIIAFDNGGEYMVMFNPVIVATEGSQDGKEGCLSLPNMSAPVVRAAQVTCQYTDAHGMPQIVTARGFLARALLHETDHLSGILYVDHLSAVDKLAMAKKLQKLAKKNGGNL